MRGLKEQWCRRSRPDFTLFDPSLVKISGGMGENVEWED